MIALTLFVPLQEHLMRLVNKLFCLSLVGLTLVCLKTEAKESIVLSGFEYSKNNSYLYAGHISPLGNSSLGNGYVQRVWLDYLTYEYSGGPGNVKAKAPGVTYALGYQAAINDLIWGAYVGVQSRTTSLSPNDPGNTSDGNKVAAIISLDLTQKITNNSSFELMGSNSPTNGYWSRMRLQLGDSVKFGPEYSVQGNDSYRNTKIGFFLGNFMVSNQLNLQLKIGHSKNENLPGSTYIGIDFVQLLK